MELKLINTNASTIVDDDLYESLLLFRWRIQENGYVISSACKEHPLFYLHKYVMGIPLQRIELDHIDRNKLNNVRSNLRLCTRGENVVNRVKCACYYPVSTSRFKGVSRKRLQHKWQVAITVNNKQIYGGLFVDEIAAAQKANELYLKHFGQFAVLNDIPL